MKISTIKPNRLATLAFICILCVGSMSGTTKLGGDVTGDNKVDVEDVNAIINIILKLKTTADYSGNADANGDDLVDVEDVNYCINSILGIPNVEPVNMSTLRALMPELYYDAGYAFLELATDNLIDANAPAIGEWGQDVELQSYINSDDKMFAWQDVKNEDFTFTYEDNSTYVNVNDTPLGIWQTCYRAIAAANQCMSMCDKLLANGSTTTLERDTIASFRGEALLSRAFHHWLLCNVFCMQYAGAQKSQSLMGIPYLIESDTLQLRNMERGNLANTFDQIERDMLQGISLLDGGVVAYDQPKMHFNIAAAHAFATRFYLAKRDYNKVVEHANAAFGGQDPADLLNDLWRQSGLYYLSEIGEYHTSVERPGVMLNIVPYSTWFRRFFSRYICSRSALCSTIQGPGPTWENCRYRNSLYSPTFSMHPCFIGYNMSSGNGNYGFAGNWFERFEYTDTLAGIGYAFVPRAEFTAEETLLCRAEAELFIGDTDAAFNDLNIWAENRRNNNSGDNRIIDLTRDNITSFYLKCLQKYETNLDRQEALGNVYLDSIYYGISVPIHIDEVCPSALYSVTPDIELFLQCIQHFRRIETVHTGMRWFDIKRLGLEIFHILGEEGQREVLTVDDPRRAIQIPDDVQGIAILPNPR